MVVLTIEDRECTDIDPARTDTVKYKDIYQRKKQLIISLGIKYIS